MSKKIGNLLPFYDTSIWTCIKKLYLFGNADVSL